MKLKRLTFLITILIILLSLNGCGLRKNKKEITNVKIGYFTNITHSQALLGINQGQFKKTIGDKIDIDWKQFTAGPNEVEALFSESIDIGYIGPGPALTAYVKSKGEVQIIAGAAEGGSILIARKDVDIGTIKDLSNKKIAVPQFGNTQDLILRSLLKDNNLIDKSKGGTVEIVQSENADTETLFEKGEIDAAIVPEPWGSKFQQEIGAKVVKDYKDLWRNGQFSTAVVVARKEFIEENPDIIENFLRAHIELTSYINENNESAKKLINDEINQLTKKSLSTNEMNNAYKRMTITYNPLKDSIEEMQDLSLNIGFIKEKTDLKGLYNLEILNKILKEKGYEEIN
ncbi:MAG: aliphatic sulfonate ABC transporter substrate-binding protein [Clostridiaceae bacterium]